MHKLVFTLLLAVLAGNTPASADDFVLELPEMVGTYPGSDLLALPPVAVSADLGSQFAEIGRASLLLSGTQSAGLVGDLNSSQLLPLGAELYAWFDGSESSSRVYVDTVLPAADGQFDLSEAFGVGPLDSGPDFTAWLDGTAEFGFAVVPPPTLATSYLVELPTVTITSAQLWIEGWVRDLGIDSGSEVVDIPEPSSVELLLGVLVLWGLGCRHLPGFARC